MTQQSVRPAKSDDLGNGTRKLRSRSASWLAWSLAALCVAMFIASVVLYFLARAEQGVPSTLSTRLTLIDLLVGAPVLVFPTVGALIASRRPHNPIGWICLAQGFLPVLYAMINYYSMYGLARPGSLPFPVGIAALSQWLWVPTIGLFPIYLVLLFPDGKLPSSRWRPLAWVAGAVILLESIAEGLDPGPLSADMKALSYGPVGAVRNPFGLEGQPWVGDASNVLLVLLLLCILASALSLILRYKRSSGEVRQQIKWIAFAASVVGILSVSVMVISLMELYFVPGSWGSAATAPFWVELDYYVWLLSFAGVPAAVGFAILKYRLYDIDLIINRTLVYGTLTAAVVGLYILIVVVLGALFQTRADLAVSLLATGAIAVLFAPLRERLQRGVNRLMYGERDDPYAVLSRLGRRLEATIAPEATLTTIVETVAQALKLPYAAIVLREGEGFRSAAAYGSPTAEPQALPLIYQREEIGRLIISPRAPGEEFSSADRSLLEDLARQAEVAVHAVRLTTDLQHSRERLVTTREEERRRLRRDLHDGLGPTLASFALKVDAARKLVRPKPGDAEELLSRLKDQTQDTVSDVRRLVYGLRPPALDDLGLVAAIRQQAESQGFVVESSPGGTEVEVAAEDGPVSFTLEVPEALPPLPAAVEVAAYRIAQEALTNLARHAHAKTCRVRISADRGGGVLELEVRDDGVGIPEGRRSGVGLSSMLERAEELGGRCDVEPDPEGGTRVLARLPLPISGERLEGARSLWKAPSASS